MNFGYWCRSDGKKRLDKKTQDYFWCVPAENILCYQCYWVGHVLCTGCPVLPNVLHWDIANEVWIIAVKSVKPKDRMRHTRFGAWLQSTGFTLRNFFIARVKPIYIGKLKFYMFRHFFNNYPKTMGWMSNPTSPLPTYTPGMEENCRIWMMMVLGNSCNNDVIEQLLTIIVAIYR